MSNAQPFRCLASSTALVVLLVSTPALAAQELSEEGRDQKAIHDYLFGTFLDGRISTFTGDGNDRGLKELTILEETREIRHGDELILPAGAERIAALFRHFAFHGADLDRIKEVRVLPFSPDTAPPRSAQVKAFYRVQMPSLPLSDKPFERMKIRFLMKDDDDVCRIDDLVFIAQNAIPREFDSIPYRDLGSESPRECVEVRIDTDHELSVGGTAELRRERWFRMHETPGTTDQSFEKWAAERGFLPGRGAFKFNPALTRGWGNQETLEQRNDKPGAADLTFFQRYDSGVRLRQSIPQFRESPFACCFNDWPEFMSVPLEGRGTPLVERFDDAAETAVASDGTPSTFNIQVDTPNMIESVRLVIGVHRSGGVAEPPAVGLNGTPVTVDTGDANGFSEFFAPLDATVPTSLLRSDNTMTVTAQAGTTVTSVQLVTHRLVD